ncbi:MAG: hypothetical protein KGI27_02260 [Thaumarchaeota archaeon]|nr:hypothetical protein [Nitrososphaerota archaeon]
MKPAIIIGIPLLILLIVPHDNMVFADQVNYFQSEDFKLTHSPTICAFEPQPDSQFPNLSQLLLSRTQYAVLDWQNHLNLGVPSRQPVWILNYKEIPLNQQYDFDDSTCDITIHYEREPLDPNEQFQEAGLTSFYNNQANIIIYYLGIDVKQGEVLVGQNANYNYYQFQYTPFYTNHLASYPQLDMTITHEMGHALGLGHYIVSNKDLYEIDTGQENMPSIMIPDIVVNGVTSFSITPLDVNEIKSIYGDNGFGQPPSTTDKFSQIINQFGNELSSSQGSAQNSSPIESSTSGSVQVDANQVLLSNNMNSSLLYISGSIYPNVNGYVDLMITDQQGGNIMWDSEVRPDNNGDYNQKVVITNEYHSGPYAVTASYNGNSLGTTSFNVINGITVPEFGSVISYVFLLPFVYVIIFQSHFRGLNKKKPIV